MYTLNRWHRIYEILLIKSFYRLSFSQWDGYVMARSRIQLRLLNWMAWQYPETLMDIRGTTQYWQLTTRDWVLARFPDTEWTCLYVQKLIIYWYILDCLSFPHNFNIKHRLGCKYCLQNIFNTKKFSTYKKYSFAICGPLHPEYAPGGQ